MNGVVYRRQFRFRSCLLKRKSRLGLQGRLQLGLGGTDLEGNDRRDICRGGVVTYIKVDGYSREA